MDLNQLRRTTANTNFQLAINQHKQGNLSKAIYTMKTALDNFLLLADPKGERKCKLYISMWDAERIWKSASSISGDNELKMRQQAVDRVEDTIAEFIDTENKSIINDLCERRYKWKAVIANHQAQFDMARYYFERARKICEQTNRHNIDYYEAAITETDAWLLVKKKFQGKQTIKYNDIAQKFKEASELYHKCHDSSNADYCDGWNGLFLFLENRTYEAGMHFELFRTKVGVTWNDHDDDSVPRKIIKFGPYEAANLVFETLVKETLPHIIKDELDVLAEQFGRFLHDELYPGTSTERGFAQMLLDFPHIVDIHEDIRWLMMEWRANSKHGIAEPTVLHELLGVAVKNEERYHRLKRIVPQTIKKLRYYKERKS